MAEMMETHPSLDEGFALVFSSRPGDCDSRSASDAVEELLRSGDQRHVEESEQLLVEGNTLLEVAYRELNVRNAVELHGTASALIRCPGLYRSAFSNHRTLQ